MNATYKATATQISTHKENACRVVHKFTFPLIVCNPVGVLGNEKSILHVA